MRNPAAHISVVADALVPTLIQRQPSWLTACMRALYRRDLGLLDDAGDAYIAHEVAVLARQQRHNGRRAGLIPHKSPGIVYL